MNYKYLPIFIAILISFSFSTKEGDTNSLRSKSAVDNPLPPESYSVYNSLKGNRFEMPSKELYLTGLLGFYDLKLKGMVEKDILTLIDYSLPSTSKRLWVIDLSTNTILYHTLVSHGRNTGDNIASDFSNEFESHKSSLGFYTTGEIYRGKHGYSLKLDGLEKGYNDNARNRGVVVHAAQYVSESFIKSHNRLGRSHGCPALPTELTAQIIQLIKNKSCLYIHHPSKTSDPVFDLGY